MSFVVYAFVGLQMNSNSAKPEYGIDAPGVIRNLILAAVAVPLLSWFVPALHLGPVLILIRPAALPTAILCLVEAALMIHYSKSGKFRHRDRMLKMVEWQGNETVLDVGTGRGLMMIGAAKKLVSGKAVGIDIWSKKDLSGNSLQQTLSNAEIEGVRNRVEVQSGDATAVNFPDGSIDVVLSNLCIHNIPSKEGRAQACREIVRVLKPGGKAIISDFIHTADYVKVFRSAGAKTTRSGMDFLFTFPPLRIVEVQKPGLAIH
jgi:arsenite methyltransferase